MDTRDNAAKRKGVSPIKLFPGDEPDIIPKAKINIRRVSTTAHEEDDQLDAAEQGSVVFEAEDNLLTKTNTTVKHHYKSIINNQTNQPNDHKFPTPGHDDQSQCNTDDSYEDFHLKSANVERNLFDDFDDSDLDRTIVADCPSFSDSSPIKRRTNPLIKNNCHSQVPNPGDKQPSIHQPSRSAKPQQLRDNPRVG